jgi:hypothetical protein
MQKRTKKSRLGRIRLVGVQSPLGVPFGFFKAEGLRSSILVLCYAIRRIIVDAPLSPTCNPLKTVSIKQVQKVVVLAHHDNVRVPRGLKYLLVFSVAQANGPNGLGLDIIVRAVDPSGKRRRELRVHPNLGHAAITG